MSEESKSWYRMTRPLFNSGFEDDEFLAYGQDGFRELLDSFIARTVQIYDKRMYTEPTSVRAIVQNVTSDAISGTTLRQILCEIGTLRCGQYVKDDKAVWLVSGLPDNNHVYEKAVLWKCKHTIRFVSPLTGEVVDYPVYSTNSTQYGTGELAKEHIAVGDSQHLVYVPYNEETIRVRTGMRIIMDKTSDQPSVYRVTQVDPLSMAVGDDLDGDGLIQWSMLQTQFNEETDNAELMVADYYNRGHSPDESDPSLNPSITLIDEDGDGLLAIGETKRIRIQLKEDGEAASGLSYELEYDMADGAARVESVENGIITLYAEKDRDNVGKTISVTATAGDMKSTLEIQIVNW